VLADLLLEAALFPGPGQPHSLCRGQLGVYLSVLLNRPTIASASRSCWDFGRSLPYGVFGLGRFRAQGPGPPEGLP
jgi:hypothetical protein